MYDFLLYIILIRTNSPNQTNEARTTSIKGFNLFYNRYGYFKDQRDAAFIFFCDIPRYVTMGHDNWYTLGKPQPIRTSSRLGRVT